LKNEKVKEKENEIIEFREIKGELNSDGRLSDYVNTTMIIEDVEFKNFANIGDCAIATVKVNNETLRLHTFSKVLIKQLVRVAEVIKQGKKVQARLVRRKRYLTFE